MATDTSCGYPATMDLRLKALQYSYRIHWSFDQRGYIATVAEFPKLHSEPADTPHAAIEPVVASVVEQLRALEIDGSAMPLMGVWGGLFEEMANVDSPYPDRVGAFGHERFLP